MATDSTNLPQGETTTLDAGMDMTASDLDLTTVQEVANEPQNFVDLPKGNTVILLPVQPGQTVKLPTDTADGVLAKIGPEGNLALVVDGRTIILQGFLKANDQSPVKIVTNDGDDVNVADLIAATDPTLDIQTAAGPAAGDQGDTDGSGIYIPFLAGPGLGGIGAEGILDPTALQYRLIDDERKLFTLDEDTKPDFDITFDILGGIVNEDDLGAPEQEPDQVAAKFVFQEGGNDGVGNDPFDVKDREAGGLDSDGDDSNVNGVDPDREPLSTVATVKVNFHGDVPGTLTVDLTKLPPSLTSEGEPIVYALDPAVAGPGGHGNGIFGYVENGANPGYQPDEDRLVFEVHVDKFNSDSEFKVTFTLHDNIDNEAPDANDDGKPDLLGANEQLLGLPVHFTITDSDGSSVGGTLPIKVEDDRPFFGEVSEVGEDLQIIDVNAVITHDESDGIQGDANDVDPSELLPLVPELGPKIIAAGFSLPFESVGAIIGTAQTQVKASFGADQASQEHNKKDADPEARNSIFGELEDRTDADGDGINDGENERPFELFMIQNGSGKDAVPTEDNLNTPAVEGNLTIADQPTNATVTWFGAIEQVFLHQIDAQTVVGYILVDGESSEEALQKLEAGESKELVFVLHIDDNGVLSFAQFHQLNHNTDGPTPADHDDTQVGNGEFNILGEDGTPLIHVRISDFDGDHATQPVNVVIQDDGPVFKQVEYDVCQTVGGVEPTHVLEHFDNLSSWTVLAGSNATTVSDVGTSDPQPDPHSQALLIGQSASQTDIESFFSLAPGTLDGVADDGNPANGAEDPTDGSAIKQTFNVHAGDVMTVKFNFLEDESDGGESGDAPSFQDFAFIVVGGEVFRLSNVGDADNPSSANTGGSGGFSWDEESGYLTFTYTFTTDGPVQVGFGVMDESDQVVDPGLLIDELKIGPGCEGAIDEDALPNGNNGGPGDDVGGTSVGGNIAFDFGVDRPGLLSINGLSIVDDKGAAIAFEDLKTADGNGVEWGSKSGPDADGWVTWTAIEEGTGEPVFVFKLDTSGAGQGDFVYELQQALSHPFTDDPADPVDTNIAWEDNLHFNFEVKATDVDGDWTLGNVKISVDDDSPKFCEVDWGCDNDSKYGVGLIDEDKLDPNGNHDWAPGDDKGGTHADGTINFKFGADQPGTLTLAGLTIKDCANPANIVLAIELNESGQPVVKSGELHTADGQLIEIVQSGPDGDGVITWQGVVAGSDPAQEAFKLTIDTAGDNIGDFDFCLSLPLQHPYHDSDSKNDGPEKSFEDNLKFDFTVIGTDADGDAATGHIKINVDDDSPKAECDVDCVTEGTHGEGELNFATGNVVTGNGDTIFGDDDNNLDGNQDHPGADQPYTISKLDHCGDCYLLVQDEEGNFHVEKNGVQLPEDGSGDANFDPASGILHIPTHEGGTLDIVLVSEVQSEVGDYKYTVPANAEHDHDIHFGPEVSASIALGSNVADWQAAFGGISVSALNGNLVIKNPIDVDPNGAGAEDYAGIGVSSGEGDEQEVDTKGSRSSPEGLRLDLPNDTNNIALTIGALFDGAQYDNGHQEILQWTIYNNGIPVGSGQILGTDDGLVTLDIDSLLPFDRVELKPINNGQGDSGNNSDFLLINAEICCPQDKFTEKFDYTLRDADGDESTATLKVDVKDTEPTHGDGQPIITKIVVDEDGLPNGVGNTDSPADDNEDHNDPNAPVDDAKHIGTIPFTPGADPVSIELSVLGGPETPLRTLDNKKVFAAWDSATSTLIGYVEGTDPNDAANQVFKMHITDAQTGAYEFELLQAVKHANSDIFIDDNTENVLNLPADFIVVAEIEDKDCDVTYSKVIVSIDDDMPVITECHDKQGNDINLLVNGGFENIGGPTDEDGGTLDRGSWGVFSKIPGWTSGHESDSNAAGLEIQNNTVIPAKEGNNYVELDSDTLNPGDPAPTSTNASIYQDVETVDGNNYVLSFSYSPREGNPATDGIEVWFDGQLITTIDSGTKGQWTDYKFVVEAGEGDGTPDLSRLEFKAVGSADSLGGFLDNVSLTACALVDEDALPNGIEGGPGDDGLIGACFEGSLGVNFGADGGKSIEFLTSGQPSLKSHGATVNYFWNDATDTLIGYTGASSGKNNPANWVFTVEVQSLDNGGEYKFTLLKPLDHPDSNDNHADDKTDNGTGSFEDNLVFELKFKATDRDDDTVTGHLKINVDDDSPKITEGSGSISLHTDETLGGGADVPPNPGTTAENDEAGAVIPGVISAQVAGTVIGFSQGNAAGLFNAQYGADGPGSTDWTLTIAGGGATGLTDTATNTAITLVAGLNGVVLGKAAGGEVVFAFSIDGSGNVTMVQYRAVNHGANEAAPGDHDEAIFMNSGVLGVTVKVTDFDGDAVTSTRDISGTISIDDDGPHATCDYDSVTEGVGNTATGNVVSGANPENPDLGTDANGTDGNADQLSQDTPHTISKLTHDGHTYELSADGLTVTKDSGALGAGESFAGGKLTITTAEGATFEIIMVSSDPADVGEYRYTAGPAPIHAEDAHYGALDLPGSITLANAGPGAFAAAFGPDVTLTAIGGSLATKTVNVAGPNDYGGIGVASSQGDEPEVDQLGQGEALKLSFATPTDNAEIQLGALFDGVQFDSGFQEIVKWEALAADGTTVIASGQILGNNNGLVLLDIDTDVPFSSIKLTPLNNGAGNSGNNSDFLVLSVEVCHQEPVKEEFGYTLRDGDGDESSAALKICVEDTYPTIPQTGNLCLFVDEDGLPAGIGNSDSPNDAPATSASANGLIPFTPGVDPVKIELSVDNGGDTGLKTVAGQTVLAAWDSATSTLIGYIAGTDPSNASNQVFKMTVTDHTTGAVTFDLLKPIQHADGGQDDNTENNPDRTLTVNVEIEDKDCDVAFTTVHVKIDDDMPVIDCNPRSNFHLGTDETVGGGKDVDPDPGFVREDDEDQIDVPSELEFAPRIGEAQADAATLFSYDAGADGLQSVGFALTILGGGATGLIDTQTNTAIVLVAGPGGIVLGKANGGTGDIVLAFHVDSDGEVTMAQYRAVNHGQDGNNHDAEIFMSPYALGVTISVTDKDGDTATKTEDISCRISIDDDGPKFKEVDFGHDGDSDRLDEDLLPVVGNGDNAPGDDSGGVHTDGTIEFNFGSDKAGTLSIEALTVTDSAGNPVSLANLHTADGRTLAYAVSPPDVNGVVTVTAVVAPAQTGAGQPVFTLTLDTSGGNIGDFNFDLHQALEHPYNDNNFKNNGPDTTYEDNLKFDFTIEATDGDGDHTTGHLTFNIDDDSPNADKVKIKLTGGEGNDNMLVHDESAGVQNKGNGSGAPDPDASGIDEDDISPAPADYAAFEAAKGIVPAGIIGYAQTNVAVSLDASGSGDAEDAIGADRPGEVSGLSLTNSSGGNVANATATNVFDTATGFRIYLYTEVVGSETFVVGRVGTSASGTSSGNAAGAISFALHVSEGGTIEVGQYRAIKHPNTGSDDDAVTLLNSNGNGAVVYVTVTVTDADGDSVKVTKPLDGGSHGAGSIVFQDDGPTAVNDTDSVTEDSIEDATGNVITGVNPENAPLGTDTNATDGKADNAGTDGYQANSVQWADGKEGGGIDTNNSIAGQYGTLIVDKNGEYQYVLDEANAKVNALNNGEHLTEDFTYYFKDNDGDKASGTLTITIDGHTDTSKPNFEDENALVDEDGLPAGILNDPTAPTNDPAPGDDVGGHQEGGLPTPANEAIFRDSLNINWDSNVGTIAFALTNANLADIHPLSGAVLTTTNVSGNGTGDLKVWDGVPNASNLILEVKVIDAATSVYEVQLYQPIKHTDPASEDNKALPVSVTATNVGGSSTHTLTISIDDDSPKAVTIATGIAPIVLDESRPVGSDTDGVAPAGLDTITVNLGATSFAAVNYGADGPGTVSYALSLTGTNVPSGLYALEAADKSAVDGDGIGQGDQIVLNQAGNTITGSVGATNYFTIVVNPANGNVTFTQLNNVWHSNTGSDDDASVLNLATADLLKLVQNVVDADGDTGSAFVNLGKGVFQIQDDGPDAKVSNAVAAAIVLDETRPIGSDTDGGAPAGTATATADYSLNFATSTYGTDGAGTTSYALALTGSNVPSGLFALEAADKSASGVDGDGIGQGAQIVLNQAGNVITGSVGATNYFTISIDPATGIVTFTQINNIWHSNTGSDDDTATLTLSNANLLRVIQSVTDRDGDTDTADINLGTGVFQIQDDGPDAKVSNAVAAAIVLDETRPIGSDTDGGAPAGTATATANYSLNFATSTYGTDGAGTTSYALALTGSNVVSGLFALDGTDKVVDGDGYGQGAQIVLNQAGNVITGSVGATNYFTISIDPATGIVTFTQLNNIWHSNTGSDDETATLTLANANLLRVIQSVTDRDGDTDTADINLGTGVFQIQDDGPVANTLTKSIVSEGVNTNLMVILDISGSMDEPSGMTDLDKIQAAIASVKELIEQYDALGDVKVRICTFSTGATEVGAVWMTVAEAKTFLNTLLDDDGSTNYDAALTAAMGAFPDTGKIVGAQNVAYFLSDGNPNQPAGSPGINGAEETAWTDFLKANDINSFALGFGEPGDVNQSAIDPVAYNGVTETNTDGQVITDLNLLTAALVATVAQTNGNLKTDGGNKNGTDVPGIVSKITFGANTFVFDGTNITRTAGSLSFTGVGGILTFSTASGTLQVNMNTGAYTYALLADAAANDLFGYTLTDADGDNAISTLQITAAVADVAPIVRDDIIIAGHNDNGGNEVIPVPAAALLWNDTDANGDAITVSGTFTNVSNLAGVALVGGNVEMTDGSDGGSFTYTGTANGKSDTGNVILDRDQEGKGNGEALEGNGLDNIIVSDSSGNILNGYEGNDVLLGGDGNDSLNGGTGRDWLVGGLGNDVATGGAGNDLIDVSEGNTDTVRYESKLDGQDVISGFDNAGGAGAQDFINLDPLFDNLGIGAGSRSALVDISTSGGNTIVKVDVDGVAGFGANDIQITILGITSGITKGTATTDDIQLGS